MPDQDIFKMDLDGMKKSTDLNLWGTIIPAIIFRETMAQTAGKEECC